MKGNSQTPCTVLPPRLVGPTRLLPTITPTIMETVVWALQINLRPSVEKAERGIVDRLQNCPCPKNICAAITDLHSKHVQLAHIQKERVTNRRAFLLNKLEIIGSSIMNGGCSKTSTVDPIGIMALKKLCHTVRATHQHKNQATNHVPQSR